MMADDFALMNSFFDQVFGNLDRGYLFAQYKRQEVVDYLCTVIEGFGCDEVPFDGRRENDRCRFTDGCRKAVEAAIRYHENARSLNNNVCLLGKYHDILYVASKLCYLFELDDSAVVESLLSSIFRCENTLEKFFEGSIFGPRITKLVSGWKSDYPTREENVRVFRYFLGRVTSNATAQVTFRCPAGGRKKFVDVPMISYGAHSPLKVALKAGRWDIVELLVRHGAEFHWLPLSADLPAPSEEYDITLPLYQQMDELLLRYDGRPMPDRDQQLTAALKVIFKAVPSLEALSNPGYELDKFLRMLREQNVILRDDLMPTLKQLARHSVRTYLNRYYTLPTAIYIMNVPETIKRYLDFLED